MEPREPGQPPPLALGIDAGGSATRWALAGPSSVILAEGELAGFSALELLGPGRERVRPLLQDVAAAARVVGSPQRAHAGLTGLGRGGEDVLRWVAEALGLPASAVTLGGDLETTYLDLFAPGEGYVVYAGTGSVAVYIDAAGTLHRAGGRGHLLDDGGGGFWIAREALRRIWRTEDERPGSWASSPMARAMFEQMGGSDWDCTRRTVYGGGRGDVGRLALAVARAAAEDPAAREILQAAGEELGRLALALVGRHGPRPVALSGRAAGLHPVIEATLRTALPAALPFSHRPSRGHHAAARLALRGATGERP